MPTFATIAWESLLEPRSEDDKNPNDKTRAPPRHIYISPPLYTTPEPAPIPYSDSDPPSPSPYVVNHKRRRAVNHRVDRAEEAPLVEERNLERVSEGSGEKEHGKEDTVGGDDVVFSEPQGVDVSSIDGLERSFVSNQGEFFDADEEFFSDGSTPRLSSYGKKLELELLAVRLSLLEETEKRKTAEEVVQQMYSQWQRLGSLLSQNGLTLPPPPNANSTCFDISLLEQLTQELVVTRFVAEAIGRGEARAEAEFDAEAVILSKDQEISRLRDKVRYYEGVNQSMCQRNQEVMEAARRQRQRKKTQRRWLWSCLGVSVVVGSSLIAFSLLPQSSRPQTSPSASDSSDADCIVSE